MKTNFRLRSLVVVLAVVLAVVPAVASVKAQDKTVVKWFVGLGTGTDVQQLEVQNQVVADFNASQSEIELQLILAGNNQSAPDALSTLIAGGDAPDIVGPVGFDGSNIFAGSWLDLQPLVDATGYDLSALPANLVDLYRSDEGLLGIPFAAFPGLIYYNKDLFDEAGLAYPPAEFGAPYVMADGTEVEWSWDTLAEIAKVLTVDANGNDATSADFDPAAIEQYGFVHQWHSAVSDFSTFGGFDYLADDGTVTIPDHWRAQAKWAWNGLWVDHFIPNGTAVNSALFQPSAFASGRVAMARTMLWYTCCVADLTANWDIGVVPSYNGEYYAPADADTYRITKASKNPEAAFTVLQYLLGEAAVDLLTTYGGYAARPDIQDELITSFSNKFPSVENWGIVPLSLEKAPSPHHEAYVPNYAKVKDRFANFQALMEGDTGVDLDVDAELDKLQADLQTIIAEQ
jgi:multiple sugar transport system substrate-binding protein